jgi:chromosome segregation ATPase
MIESLEQLTASFEAVNIPQITTDMAQITEDLEIIVEGVQDYTDAVIEYNGYILEYNEAINEYNDAMLAYQEQITTAEEFLNDIDGTIEGMVEALSGLQALYEEGNEWAGIFIQIANIRLGLQDILAIMKTKATKEQMEQLLAQVENIGEGIDQLVAVADYDYDGVINALDKCPETPLTKINEVNANGCAPGETPVSDD